jgi:glyoxylase-like metal-dependent hydrolase (beta-lactamase superfamily II)
VSRGPDVDAASGDVQGIAPHVAGRDSDIACIPVPLEYLGSVNVWLLAGEPLTLVDTGPANDEALAFLESELARLGVAVEEIELVLITHHHLDHSGLAGAIKERSGAQIAAHRTTARWGRDYYRLADEERRFGMALMAAHGVPPHVIADSEEFFARIIDQGRPFGTDRVLADGDTLLAGGRRLRTVFRPGHSTTDTIFVDESSDDAFVGDHLLANVTSGVELVPTELSGDERRRALLEYLGNLRKTQAMGLRHCYPGHGPRIDDHRALIEKQLSFHAERLDRITELVRAERLTAYEIAKSLWTPETAETQPLLVTWEVLGHLDVLVNRGTVREQIGADGRHAYHARR